MTERKRTNLEAYDLRQILAEARNASRATYGSMRPVSIQAGDMMVPADLVVGLIERVQKLMQAPTVKLPVGGVDWGFMPKCPACGNEEASVGCVTDGCEKSVISFSVDLTTKGDTVEPEPHGEHQYKISINGKTHIFNTAHEAQLAIDAAGRATKGSYATVTTVESDGGTPVYADVWDRSSHKCIMCGNVMTEDPNALRWICPECGAREDMPLTTKRPMAKAGATCIECGAAICGHDCDGCGDDGHPRSKDDWSTVHCHAYGTDKTFQCHGCTSRARNEKP